MSSIKKNYLYNTAFKIFAVIVPLITTPYITRVLGADGLGTYSYYFSIANYFSIFILLGLSNYGNREIAKARDCKQELSKVFWSIYLFQLAMGVLVGLLYLASAVLISDNKIISLIVGLHLLSNTLDVSWVYAGLEEFKSITIRNFVLKIITTAGIFTFVKTSQDVVVYAMILMVGRVLSQLVMWPKLIRIVSFYKPSMREIAFHIAPNLKLFLTVLALSLFKIMDKIMLGAITTESQVGFYEAAEKIIDIPIILVTSLGAVMLPRMSNMVARGQSGNKIIGQSICFAMAITCSMCFGLMGVSREFVPIFFGAGFEVCVWLLLLLLPSCVFMSFANVIRTQYLIPNEKDKPYILSAFLGAATNLTLNVILIPKLGAVGAAVGTLAAEIVVCFYQCASVRHSLPLGKLVKMGLPSLIAAVVMFAVVWSVELSTLPTLAAMMLKVVLGVVIFGSLMLIFDRINIMKREVHLWENA